MAADGQRLFLFNETLMLWKSTEETDEKDLTRYKKSSLMFGLSLIPFGSRYIYLQHNLSSTEVSGKSATNFTGSRLVPPRGDPLSMLSSAAEGATNACPLAACCAKPIYLNHDSIRSSFSD